MPTREEIERALRDFALRDVRPTEEGIVSFYNRFMAEPPPVTNTNTVTFTMPSPPPPPIVPPERWELRREPIFRPRNTRPRNTCFQCKLPYTSEHYCFTDRDEYETFRDCQCSGCRGGFIGHVTTVLWPLVNGNIAQVPPRPPHTGLRLKRNASTNKLERIAWVCELCTDEFICGTAHGLIPLSMQHNRNRRGLRTSTTTVVRDTLDDHPELERHLDDHRRILNDDFDDDPDDDWERDDDDEENDF